MTLFHIANGRFHIARSTSRRGFHAEIEGLATEIITTIDVNYLAGDVGTI